MAYEQPAKMAEYQSRQGDGEMDSDVLRSVLRGILADCRSYVDEELSPLRAKATRYYKGEPFGNEEDGRSQVVLTQVRDGVNAVIPSLVRVFHGSERTVEFVPRKAENTAMAEQATDYIQYIYEQENNGFAQTLSVLKDGLLRKTGVLKWGWDKSAEVKVYEYENLSQSELDLLAADDEVELVKVEQIVAAKPPTAPPPPPPPGQPPVAPLPPVPVGDPAAAQRGTEAMFNVTLKRTDSEGKPWVQCLPPEEFWFNRDARTVEDALVCAHASDKTRGELRAMGVSDADLEAHGSTDLMLQDSEENIARRSPPMTSQMNDPQAGEPNQKVRYVEAYVKLDFDGDGIAELRKICTIGPTFYPVSNDPWSKRRPFSVFCPGLEPHTLVGTSYADLLMDVQLTQSSILRATLDSLSASIFPRVTYVEGQVSVADILNNSIGAPIRTRNIDAIRPLVTPFAGKEAIPFLDFFNAVVERRTGRNNASAGLKADALQSTSAGAVDAVVTASQEQAELLARTFAETCFKPMFYGLLELLAEHKPRARMLRLRNKWVEVDPRTWDSAMDVKVNVALGTSFIEQKLAALAAIAEDQHAWVRELGPVNPMVSLAQIRYTRAKYIELQGLPDANPFYKEVDPNWQPPAPQAPPPSPEMIKAQGDIEIERMKVEGQLKREAAKLNWQESDAIRKNQLELRRMELEAETKRFAIIAQFKGQYTSAQMNADVQRDVAGAQAELDMHDQVHDQHIERQGQEHEQMIAEQGQEHEQMMAEKGHDLAQQQADQAAAEPQAA